MTNRLTKTYQIEIVDSGSGSINNTNKPKS